MRCEKGTILLNKRPALLAGGAVAGKKEGEGPLEDSFDYLLRDGRFGQKSWEKAETELQNEAVRFALDKAKLSASDLDCIFSGDLLNQCVASSFAHRATDTAYLGLYGACSTFAEGLALSAMFVNAGYARYTAACASSHFCSAERQYRYPMEYGGQRTPTAQWTVTGAGCVLMGFRENAPCIDAVAIGKIVDAGITDVNNMGAAMAPAAYETVRQVFDDTATAPEDYDLIVTGDLGQVGSDLFRDLFLVECGCDLKERHMDCGVMMFDPKQGVNAGGSGAGCSAAVFAGYLLREIQNRRYRRVLFAGTGALLSPLSSQQGESIPGICHAVRIGGV
ncbi:MAG: stage V sporulation protein AD [Oscillospiraceae bacterium]|nr:stage V sporulation protein AD [Oscillospiraceae bacterium]